MAIDDNKKYTLSGAQLKDLISRVKIGTENAIRTLTEDDYDFNSHAGSEPDGVALWRLPAGIYKIGMRQDSHPNYCITVYTNTFAGYGYTKGFTLRGNLIICSDYTTSNNGDKYRYYLVGGGTSHKTSGIYNYDYSGAWQHLGCTNVSTGASIGNGTYGSVFLTENSITDDLNATTTPVAASVLSARAGFRLRDEKLSIANLEVGEGLKITTTGTGANTKIKIELDSNDETEY